MMKELLLVAADMESGAVMGAGLVTSFVAGLVSLRILLRVLVRGNLHWFGGYCFVLGFVTMGM